MPHSTPLGAGMGASIGGVTPLSLAEVEAFDPQGGRGPEHGRRWRCPLCQAKERSLSVNATTGAYNCKRQSCGTRGLLLEHRTHNTQGLQSRGYRAQAKARALASVFSLGAPAVPSASTWREALSALEPLAETAGAKYLQGRGIAPELAQACGVRFAPTWAPRGEGTATYRAGAAVVFPMRDRNAALIAANGRYLSPDATPKTRTGGASGLGAFAASVGREEAPDARLSPFEAPAVILCEGPMDALSLATCGFPALAVSGCNLPAWIPAACAFKRVLLASDADASGDDAASTWRQAVRPFAAEVERLAPPVGKDWNEALQVLGRDALAAWLAAPTLPFEAPKPQVLEPPQPATPEQKQQARELAAIVEALPDAQMLKSGAWRIGGEVVSHDDALLMAAKARGKTSGGYPLEVAASTCTPPEPAPPGATWCAPLGLWMRRTPKGRATAFLVTVATAENWQRYAALHAPHTTPPGKLQQMLPWATAQQVDNLAAAQARLNQGATMAAIVRELGEEMPQVLEGETQ